MQDTLISELYLHAPILKRNLSAMSHSIIELLELLLAYKNLLSSHLSTKKTRLMKTFIN